MSTRLRVYQGSHETGFSENQEPTVRVSLADLLPLLALAKRHNYLWLQDFLDDEVCVTPDLYDILRSFRTTGRTSA